MQNYYAEEAETGAAGCDTRYKTTNPAAVYKGFNISINREQLQKIARLEQWNFDLKTLSEALLFRNTHNTQTAGWRGGVSTHTPSCLEPFSTKIGVERWSLNCWLIPRLCLNWTLTVRERQIAPCVTSRVNAQREVCPLSPSSHSCPSWEVQAIKIKVLTLQHLYLGQDAPAGGAWAAE